MTILRGLRVVEVPGSGAAAWAAKQLADWGAEVILLEPPEGSPLRDAPPYYQRDGVRRSGTWAWLSRGTRAVRVGPGTAVRPEDARELCERADVVLLDEEMVRPVLGLAPAEVRPSFQDKTTCVLISPFDPDGPYAGYQASDLIVHAKGGWMGMLGDADREPLRPGGEIMARVAGVMALGASLVALRHARLGGGQQFVNLSCQAVAAFVITVPWLVKSMTGRAPRRSRPQWPQRVMECKDGYVGCSPLTATHWEMLCHMMGIADVLDLPGGREQTYRMEHGDELYERVKPWLRERTRREIVEMAQTWRLPSASVDTVTDRLACPHLNARGFFVQAQVDGKQVKVPRPAFLIRDIHPVERRPLEEVERVDLSSSLRPERRADAPALPFDGVRVLDLTWFWSGPSATMLLGALGADVIKIESIQRPDSYRFQLTDARVERWYERGPLWNDANCDKRSLTLNLNHPAGRELFERLVAKADVVISNFSNRVMPNLGYTPERLLELNPRLIAVTMPGYGPGGPWEDYVGYGVSFEQLAVCASVTGYPDGPPLIMGGFSDPTAGMHAVAAVELALRYREQTGRGTTIEVPQCEVLDSLWAPEHIAVQHGAAPPTRQGNKHVWMAPHGAYRVAGEDRWIAIAVSSDKEFAALAEAIGLPDLAADGRFATVAARKEHEVELDAVIAGAVQGCDGAALERTLQRAGVKAAQVSVPADLDQEEGLRHVRFFQSLSRPVSGTHLYRTWPFRFSSIDTSHKRRPPLLGEHNAEILTELLGLNEEEIGALEAQHVIGTAPLGAEV